MFCFRQTLVLACLTTALTFPAWGQSGALGSPDQPGGLQNDSQLRTAVGAIIGSVRTLDNSPVADARIEVSSLLHGGVVATQYTSQDGGFMVTNLPQGSYEVRADSGADQAGERVQVDGGQAWLTLRLQGPGHTATRGAQAGGATVSVRQLRVPEKAASLLDKAREAMVHNKLQDAAKYVGKALDAYPEYAQALALRGILEMQAMQFDRAAADAGHAIHADPNNGMGYLIMGATLNCQQKFQDALRPLAQAQALIPNSWQVYFESSKALLQLGKFQDALRQVDKAAILSKADPRPDFHLIKGYAYLGLKVYGSALTELQQYLSQVPAGPHTAEVRSTLEKIRPLAPQPTAR